MIKEIEGMFARTRREYDDAQKGGRDVSWPPYGFRGQVLQGFAFCKLKVASKLANHVL